jgi:hypothetical protein
LLGFADGQDNAGPPASMGGYSIVFTTDVGQATGVDADADGAAVTTGDDTFQPVMIPLGDINSDGFDDFIAAVSDDVSLSTPTLARVYFGRSTVGDAVLDADAVTLRLPAPILTAGMDGSRTVFATPGDYNGDGTTDIAFAVTRAAGSPTGPVDEGVYILFGRSADGWSGEVDAVAQSDVLIAGATDATSPDGVGDLNNDGFDDLAILESGEAVHVLYGRSDDDWTAATTLQSSADGFVVEGDLWHLTDRRGADGGHSAEHSFYFGDEIDGNYENGGVAAAGTLTSPIIDLTAAVSASLSFNYFLETEGNGAQFDQAIVSVAPIDGDYAPVASNTGDPAHEVLVDPSGTFLAVNIDLAAYVGQQVRVRFSFDTVDAQENTAEGFYVDDVTVTTDNGDLLAADFSVRRLDLGDADVAISGTFADLAGLGDTGDDGADDLALLSGDEVRIYLGDPGGAFDNAVDVILDHPDLTGFELVALGDTDADGRHDLAVSSPRASYVVNANDLVSGDLADVGDLVSNGLVFAVGNVNGQAGADIGLVSLARTLKLAEDGAFVAHPTARIYLDGADLLGEPSLIIEPGRPAYADLANVDPDTQPDAYDALVRTLRVTTAGDVNGDDLADLTIAENLGFELHIIEGDTLLPVSPDADADPDPADPYAFDLATPADTPLPTGRPGVDLNDDDSDLADAFALEGILESDALDAAIPVGDVNADGHERPARTRQHGELRSPRSDSTR